MVGRIVTLDEPPIAEALFVQDGTVAAVGARDEVLSRAGDQVPVIDIGQNVAYPGFVDAHAHCCTSTTTGSTAHRPPWMPP